MSGLAQGSIVAGKYRLERLIGRGGMGSVWAGRHLQLDTEVALKFIDPVAAADAAEARARFEREAKAAAQLRSPHVVQILDHGMDGDQPYIAMELLEGEDLGERLRRDKRLSIQAMAAIVTQAAKALRRAHDAGVIHRDLKPSNIFLARFDDDEVVKLLDFGVAKLRYKEAEAGMLMTQTGVIFGSPSYMSPEQARGNRVIDHRTDLWSLAVILFRALTGVKPFEASSIGDLVIKLCIDPLPVPTAIAPDLPPELDRFFARAFARDPDERFPSAMALAAELEAIAGVRPASSPSPQASSPSTQASLPARQASSPALIEQASSPIEQASFIVPPVPPMSTPRPSLHSMDPTPVPVVQPHFNDTPAVVVAVPPAPPPPFDPPSGGFAISIPDAARAALSAQAPPPPPSPRPYAPPIGAHAFDPPTPRAAPSMTPSPAMLAPRSQRQSAPDRRLAIVAASLGVGAIVLVLLVVGALRHRAVEGSPVEASAAAARAPDPAPSPPLPTATATAVEVAPSAVAPPVDTAVDPAASTDPALAAPEGSGKAGKPGKIPGGKPGRGRTPNFGY